MSEIDLDSKIVTATLDRYDDSPVNRSVRCQRGGGHHQALPCRLNRAGLGVVTKFMGRLTYRGPSLATLHEDYAKHRKIDEFAPVRARANALIDSPVATVWQKLSDVPSWADNLERNARDISLADGVRVDGEFRRTLNGARVRARFAVVDEERELAWTGTSLGVRVVHRYTLDPDGPRRTRVIVEESMAGPPMIALISSQRLTRVLQQSLDTLRQTCETDDASRPST